MEYNKYIPDIYHVQSNIYDIKSNIYNIESDFYNIESDIYNLDKKYLIKKYKLKSNKIMFIPSYFYTKSNYCYIKTDCEQLYFKNFSNLIKIYDKMIKNNNMNDYIINKSNYDANIEIYIILKKYWNNNFMINPISISLLDNYKTNCVIYENDKFYNVLYFYDRLYIKTITEIKDNNIEINSNEFILYYHSLKICNNIYELRIKKIYSEKHNINVNLNTTINLDNLDKNYNMLKKYILKIFKLKIYIIKIDINKIFKLYNIIKIYGEPTIFSLN